MRPGEGELFQQRCPGGQDEAITSPAESHVGHLRPKSKGGGLKKEKENKSNKKTIGIESGPKEKREKVNDMTKSVKDKNNLTKTKETREKEKNYISKNGNKIKVVK